MRQHQTKSKPTKKLLEENRSLLNEVEELKGQISCFSKVTRLTTNPNALYLLRRLNVSRFNISVTNMMTWGCLKN